MKSLVKIGTTFLIVFACIAMMYSPLAAQNANSKLFKKLDQQIAYPYLSKDRLYGFVNLELEVTQEGKLEVTKGVTDNPELLSYVERRIKRITLPIDDALIGTSQEIVFRFKEESECL
jgi:hypothetical protein